MIRGVAGSGKTLILASRAKLLSREHPDWKILILCYNISLAQNIEHMVRHMMNEPDSLFDFDFTKEETHTKRAKHLIQVRNFHSWLRNDLRISEATIPMMLEKLKQGEAILPKYDAIMIDEGQDFDADWFKLVSELLNPDTKSLLLVEDRAQSIYKRGRSYLQDTGLDFRGRSKVLSINYRNTAQIVSFAWAFYQQHSVLKNKVVSKEFEGDIIAPQSTRRKGYEPAIVRVDSFRREAVIVAKQIAKLHCERKLPLSEILILYRVKRFSGLDYIALLKNALEQEDIPYYWIAENSDSKRNFDIDHESVKISTIESSKGLDFQAVFIVSANNIPFALEEDIEREASLLYIGMTRAKEYLCISYSGESEFTAYFDKVLEDRKKEEEPDVLDQSK